MKKLALILLLPCVLLISACSSMDEFMYGNNSSDWNEYNFQNANVNTILVPGQAGQHNYQASKKYYVTADDQQQYNALNDRIQKHQQNLQTQSTTSNSTNLGNAATAPPLPATTIPMSGDSTTQQGLSTY